MSRAGRSGVGSVGKRLAIERLSGRGGPSLMPQPAEYAPCNIPGATTGLFSDDESARSHAYKQRGRQQAVMLGPGPGGSRACHLGRKA